MGAAALSLPQAPRSAVFRAMETVVRGNPTFQRIVKPASFRTWSGQPEDAKPFTYEIAPAMRWTPTSGPEQFNTPSSMVGPLFINCEILIKGTDCDDVANLWWMLERCFYPDQPGSNTIAASLNAAGAFTGLVFFTQPAYDPDPDGVWLAASGQMRIDVLNAINS